MNINLPGYLNEKKKTSNIAYDDLSFREGKREGMAEMFGFNFGKQTKDYVILLHNNNRVSLVLFLRYNSC